MARQRRTPKQDGVVDVEHVGLQPTPSTETRIHEEKAAGATREFKEALQTTVHGDPQGEIPEVPRPFHSDVVAEKTDDVVGHKYDAAPIENTDSYTDPNPVLDCFDPTPDSYCEVKPTPSVADTPSVRDLIRGRQSAQSSEKKDKAPATGSVLKGIIDSRKPSANKIGVAEEIRNRKAGRKSGSSVSQVIFDRRYRRNN